jgi:hypothetical protein
MFHVEQSEGEANGCRSLRAKMRELPPFCLEIGHISNASLVLNRFFRGIYLMNIDPPWALN